MSTQVQTMTNLGNDRHVVGLRTPLYVGISLLGGLIFVAAFLPWAGVKTVDGDGYATSVTGLNAGGWGLSAMIVGVIIALLGVLGYFWNPYSDPEAMFIAAFSAAALTAGIVKILDSASLISGTDDFPETSANPRLGLWLVAGAAALSLLGALWILYSRPRAERRLAG